jgi:FlaA1/EpsC-like NDP-sugar epimerase
LLEQLRDSSILVTGAGGSIGSALSLRLAKLRPRKLVLLEASEQALYRLNAELESTGTKHSAQLALGNVADRAHLDEICAVHSSEIFFHAAAYKHAPLLEEHPLAAIANNALATMTLLECAEAHGVLRAVLLSTDKAVAPANILGATKRIAELITLAHQGVVVRLANVLGTEGSVVETFRKQIEMGGPVTVSELRAERYFLTCDEAIDLLLASACAAQPGNLLAPQLNRAHTIVELAEFLLSALAPGSGISIRYSGLRPGDKLLEALWSAGEIPVASEVGGCVALTGIPSNDAHLIQSVRSLSSAIQQRDLPLAMQIVQQLVPDFNPGSGLMALVEQARAKALQP